MMPKYSAQRMRASNQNGEDHDAQARGLIGYLATRELSIPGSEVARRFNQDRSAVSRAAQRVGNDAQLMRTARKILEQLRPK